MSLLGLFMILAVAATGFLGVAAVAVWLANRINQVEGPRYDQAKIGESDDLRLQVEALQTEVDRLRARVDFTEKLLEKPRED